MSPFVDIAQPAENKGLFNTLIYDHIYNRMIETMLKDNIHLIVSVA